MADEESGTPAGVFDGAEDDAISIASAAIEEMRSAGVAGVDVAASGMHEHTAPADDDNEAVAELPVDADVAGHGPIARRGSIARQASHALSEGAEGARGSVPESSVVVELDEIRESPADAPAEKAKEPSRPPPNPMYATNYVSRYTFWWLNPLFRKGSKRPLEDDDLFELAPEDQSHPLTDGLLSAWAAEREKSAESSRKPKLWRAYARQFGWIFFWIGVLSLFELGCQISQPILLSYLIDFVGDSTAPVRNGYLYAMGLVLGLASHAFLHHMYFFFTMRLGMQMRVAAIGAVYKKALGLGHRGLVKTTTGHVVNLVSNDVQRFDQLIPFLHFLWIGPLQCALMLWLSTREVGVSAVAGFALIFLLAPFQAWSAKVFVRLRRASAKLTDERVRVMGEVISGMRVMKMYAWEGPYSDVVRTLRASEMAKVLRTGYLRAANLSFYFFSPAVISFVTFVTFHFLGGDLTPSKVFTTVSYLAHVRLSMTLFVPVAIQALSESRVALERLENFLLHEEIKPRGEPSSRRASDAKPANGGSGKASRENSKTEAVVAVAAPALKPHVRFNHVSASWEAGTPTLTNITFQCEGDHCLAIVGPVGSGKTSLLMATLGELETSSGNVSVRGRLAYAGQEAWIISGTLRDNILFGLPYDEARYVRAIEACALDRDIMLFEDGDMTEIGERGITLSGGQRARVSLARAVYADADVYLLDDPLSAVDAAVGRHIFDCCIRGALRGKPVVLVTHQLQYLGGADAVLVLNRGEQVAVGPLDELVRAGFDLSQLIGTAHQVESPGRDARKSEANAAGKKAAQTNGKPALLTRRTTMTLIQKEERGKGSVAWEVYRDYFRAGGTVLTLMALLVMSLCAQGALVTADWWLSFWSSSTFADRDRPQNIAIYAGLIGATIVISVGRALLFFGVLLTAAKNLHNTMFRRLLRAPVFFFDSNPIGRILNRFSKDIGLMDDMLPYTFYDFIQCAFMVLGSVLLSAVINPWVFIPLVPLVIAFFKLRSYFLATSREIKRIDGTTRSPIYSHFSSTLAGLATIRGYGAQDRFFDEFMAKQDANTRAFFLFLATARWLGQRLDFLCVCFVAATAFFAIFARDRLDGGLVGLSLAYALQLTGLFQWCVRQSAEVENYMTSVERVLEYTRLESEAEPIVEPRPPKEWPSVGSVLFDNMTLRYRPELPPALSGVSVEIAGGTKVGVIGRTGSGKSTLMGSLFRLVEHEGAIWIDGIKISTVGLFDLRSKLSVIPQDPVLFSGSVRKNLDPFGQHSDEALWEALSEVQLSTAVKALPGGLEAQLAESGANFSVGQRQLICLARAILRRNKILVIDEATANVDLHTDALIQGTLRRKFASCTVLTVAHRLNTIIDSDTILVFDGGRLAERGSPHELAFGVDGAGTNASGRVSHFRRLIDETGRASADQMLGIIEAQHKEKASASSAAAQRPSVESVDSVAVVEVALDTA